MNGSVIYNNGFESPSCFPTLVNLGLRTIISDKLHKIIQKHLDKFLKKTEETTTKGDPNKFLEKTKGIIIEWELEKIYDELPELLQNNEIHYDIKKIDKFRKIIRYILRILYKCKTLRNPIINGGFVRDYYCRYDLNFNDIDIKFRDMHALNYFVSELANIYNVIICDEKSVNIHPKPEQRIICHHCNPDHEDISNNEYNNAFVKTIKIEDKTNGVSIQMDLTLQNEFRTLYDFDVNMLGLRKKKLLYIDRNHSTNSEEFLKVLTHIKNKEFVVLSNNKSKLCHADASYSRYISDIHTTRYNCSKIDGDCICRNSNRGKKLQTRILKMQKRGWKMLNEPCTNPLCFLAPIELYEKYTKDLIKWENMEKKLKKRREEYRKNIEELKRLEKSHKFTLNEKEIKISDYNKQTIKNKNYELHEKSKKINKKQYRKGGVNKNKIFMDYDDYDLAKEMDYLDDDIMYEEGNEEESFNKNISFKEILNKKICQYVETKIKEIGNKKLRIEKEPENINIKLRIKREPEIFHNPKEINIYIGEKRRETYILFQKNRKVPNKKITKENIKTLNMKRYRKSNINKKIITHDYFVPFVDENYDEEI